MSSARRGTAFSWLDRTLALPAGRGMRLATPSTHEGKVSGRQSTSVAENEAPVFGPTKHAIHPRIAPVNTPNERCASTTNARHGAVRFDREMVEMRGLEPLTPAMRTRCSPS